LATLEQEEDTQTEEAKLQRKIKDVAAKRCKEVIAMKVTLLIHNSNEETKSCLFP
jgi:hypothetical protein